VRMSRAAGFRFRMVGHGQREDAGYRVGTLRASYRHYAFSKGVADWLERHNRYSTDEAEYVRHYLAGASFLQLFATDTLVRRRALKAFSYRLPFRPTLRFAYMYLLCGGFRDGVAGFRYAKMMATYERMIDLKLHE
jgi:hypothetical protein